MVVVKAMVWKFYSTSLIKINYFLNLFRSIFEGYWDEDDWAEGLLVKSDGEI
jgi:hypothetical protein